jgi:hypothetical protein
MTSGVDDKMTIRATLAIVLAIITLGYMLPFSVALLRDQRNKLAIFLLNFFLGWTFIGWVVALVWAARSRH